MSLHIQITSSRKPTDLAVLIQKYRQLLDRDPEISLVKLVRNVPADRSELSPFLDKCVKETESEQHPLPSSFVGDAGEEVRIRNRIGHIRTQYVEAESLRRFVSHFNAVLQYGNRKRF